MKLFASVKIEVKITSCLKQIEVLEVEYAFSNKAFHYFSPENYMLRALLYYIQSNAPNLAGAK
jgi:hypothetical protein